MVSWRSGSSRGARPSWTSRRRRPRGCGDCRGRSPEQRRPGRRGGGQRGCPTGRWELGGHRGRLAGAGHARRAADQSRPATDPDGQPTACPASGSARDCPASPVEQARKVPARDLVADIRALDSRLKASRKRMQDAVENSGSSRPDIVGVGPVVAARVLGRASRASRFRTAAAFAVHVGAARIEIASADKARHRLSCQDDRKLDNALHAIALTQVRIRNWHRRERWRARSARLTSTRGSRGGCDARSPNRTPATPTRMTWQRDWSTQKPGLSS